MSAPPNSKFILLATIVAKGKDEADQIQAILTKVAARANSSEEPNCFTYQPARSIKDPNTIVVFEQYDNTDGSAMKDHRAGKDFQELMSKAGEWTTKVDMQYFDVIPPKL